MFFVKRRWAMTLFKFKTDDEIKQPLRVFAWFPVTVVNKGSLEIVWLEYVIRRGERSEEGVFWSYDRV